MLDEILHHFDHFYTLAVSGQTDAIVSQYHAALYRREGTHPYMDTATGEQFSATQTSTLPIISNTPPRSIINTMTIAIWDTVLNLPQ